MDNLTKIIEGALKGDKIMQKSAGDCYAEAYTDGHKEAEGLAVHWYKVAFINKNKDGLSGLEKLAEHGSEAAMSVIVNIYLNGDLNGEGRDLKKAFSAMRKLCVKNTGIEPSQDFINAWECISSDSPDIEKAYEFAKKITDSDKKNYALMFRPIPEKIAIPIPLNSYLQYTANLEKEMLKREGKEQKILAPEVYGGWGLSDTDAIEIKTDGFSKEIRDLFIVRCERPIAEKVLYRHALDLGLSNIHYEEENQILAHRNNARYDVLEYHVSGIPLSLLPNLRSHFEQTQNDKDEQAAEKNFYLHRTFMAIYHIKYWFKLP